jgi:hypothetical protein
MAYVVLGVRFNYFVRLFSVSFITITLDLGGWLDLAQQGLSPCKKCQALLGALTDRGSAAARVRVGGFAIKPTESAGSRRCARAEQLGCNRLLIGVQLFE